MSVSENEHGICLQFFNLAVSFARTVQLFWRDDFSNWHMNYYPFKELEGHLRKKRPIADVSLFIFKVGISAHLKTKVTSSMHGLRMS